MLLALTAEGLQNASADGSTRTLSFHHTHTREDITVTFKRNGRYDDAGLAKLNHFLRDWRNDDVTKMDPRLFDILWEVVQETGGKEPIQIISAYRSPSTNAMLRARSRGVAKHSQHTLGKAMDFNIPGVSLEQVRIAGLRLQRGGVGFYPSSNFVHMDVGSVRHWPRMSYDQLARVFPSGRTVHIPSNGQPLPGYELAMADIERRGSSPPSQVSLAAARDAGVALDAAGKGKRGLFARLFGVNSEEDDEEAATAKGPAGATARTNAAPSAAKPEQVAAAAAAVPLPRSRPAAPRPVLVASASPGVPAAAAARSAVRTPAQIIEARGLWTAADLFAAASLPPPRTASNPRVVSRNTPPPPVVKDGTTVVAKSTESARRAAAVAIATAGSDITASLPSWAREGTPEETVFAYAAPETPETVTTRPARAMGTLAPARSGRAKPEVLPEQTTRSPAAGRDLIDNPWLRGVIAAPSVQSSMGVTAMGPPNYRIVAQMMRKPSASVVNVFAVAEAAPFGLTTQTFSGSAVTFVPVVTFGTLTAGLR